MTNSEITDPVFHEAVEAIDSGNIELLESILINHPDLAARRLAIPGEGYFSKPYLLWFMLTILFVLKNYQPILWI